MAKKSTMGLTVKRDEDMAEWYSQVVLKAEVADYAPVRGCMVIRPYGYSIWQNIVRFFDDTIKAHGVENAYFPSFIPESFFKKEAEHAEGFEPEVAWVSNKDEDSKERIALRPTSETIMYDSYSRWIRSWRELPLKINQWCNIFRWEVKDVKMFLRSREFLWQEGHCVYTTEEECHKETLFYLEQYRKVCEDILAMPVIKGQKTEKEKFAGALRTYSIEGFMPDGKALQLATSHDLGQGFAKAFGISYIGKDEKSHTPWQNSWGLSTRTVGAAILQHSDDYGLVLPPKVAPIKAVIVPIIFKGKGDEVLTKAKELQTELEKSIGTVKLDDRDDYSAGWKFNEWELKGIPLRIEIGPKDIEKDQVVVSRRDIGKKEAVPAKELNRYAKDALDEMQQSLLEKARKNMQDSMQDVDSWEEFLKASEQRKLIRAPFCGEVDCEDIIKADTNGVTTRNIPLDSEKPKVKKCIRCGKDAKSMVYFSRAY